MNQDQRKYLIKVVEDQCEKQQRALIKPYPPSLNNYLIAAILDNSIQYADINNLKEKVRQLVLSLGNGDDLIGTADRYSRRHNYDLEDKNYVIQLKAEDIFILPSTYLEARKEYEEKREIYTQQIKQLESFRDTIIMKIQLGSNKILEKLINDVDNMADLKIVNQHLLLSDNSNK